MFFVCIFDMLLTTFLLGDLTIEGFTCLMIFKNFFSFALTWKAYDWVVQGGVIKTFNAIAIVQLVICLTSIPMCKSLLWP